MKLAKAIARAQYGDTRDIQRGAKIVLRYMERDCSKRAERGALQEIVQRARLYFERLSYLGRSATPTVNNRRKFFDAWFEYANATGLALTA